MARISTNPLARCINLPHQPLLPSNPGLIGHPNPPMDSISSALITASSADYRSSAPHDQYYPCFSSNSCKRKRSRCRADSPESSSSTEVIALSAESLMAANRADQKCGKGYVQRDNDHHQQQQSLIVWHYGRSAQNGSSDGMMNQDTNNNYRIMVRKGKQESANYYNGTSSDATKLTDMMMRMNHEDDDEDERNNHNNIEENGTETINNHSNKNNPRNVKKNNNACYSNVIMINNNYDYNNEKDCTKTINNYYNNNNDSEKDCTKTINNYYNTNNDSEKDCTKTINNYNKNNDQLLNNHNNNKRRVYVCPIETCAHHHRSKALGDLTGIRKHFNRKHGERKWKCQRCPKAYAVQSDWKAHLKICGLREFLCDFCNQIFTRKDKFSKHRDYCRALTEEKAKVVITDLDHISAANRTIMVMPPTNPSTESTIPHEISSDQSCTSTNSGINSADNDAKPRVDPVNNYPATSSNYNVINPSASMSQSRLNPASNISVFSSDGSSIYSRDSARVANYDNNVVQLPGYRSSAGNSNTSTGTRTLSADDQKDSMYANFGLALNSDISRRSGRSNTDPLLLQQHSEMHLNPPIDAAAIMRSGTNYCDSNQLQYNNGRGAGVINDTINADARDLNADCSLLIGERCYQVVHYDQSTECRSTDYYGYAYYDQMNDPEGEIGARSSNDLNRYSFNYNTMINQTSINDRNVDAVTRDFLSSLS